MTLLVFFIFCLHSFAAQKPDSWYKVESPQEVKSEEDKNPYQFDSLESPGDRKNFSDIGYWSRRPKWSIGAGFLADSEVFDKGKTNRWFIATEISFLNKMWHRFIAGGLLLQNNTFFLNSSWHYLPSRKAFRSYYGLGVAIQLLAEKESRSLLEVENYFLTATFGLEQLLTASSGLRGEVKTYLGTKNSGVHLLFSYILHL